MHQNSDVIDVHEKKFFFRRNFFTVIFNWCNIFIFRFYCCFECFVCFARFILSSIWIFFVKENSQRQQLKSLLFSKSKKSKKSKKSNRKRNSNSNSNFKSYSMWNSFRRNRKKNSFSKKIQFEFNKKHWTRKMTLSRTSRIMKRKKRKKLSIWTRKMKKKTKKKNKKKKRNYWKNHKWLSFYCSESRCSNNIHEMKTQKVCECQSANLNKNALVFLSSNYINWFFDYLFAKIVFLNTFSQHSSVFFAQYSNELSLKLSCKLSQRWVLKFSQRCIVWSFRANFLDDVNSVKLNHTSMRKLQKRTNRNSWFQIWRKIDL